MIGLSFPHLFHSQDCSEKLKCVWKAPNPAFTYAGGINEVWDEISSSPDYFLVLRPLLCCKAFPSEIQAQLKEKHSFSPCVSLHGAPLQINISEPQSFSLSLCSYRCDLQGEIKNTRIPVLGVLHLGSLIYKSCQRILNAAFCFRNHRWKVAFISNIQLYCVWLKSWSTDCKMHADRLQNVLIDCSLW